MENMYYVKIHRVNNNNIVAICDEEILGKVFREGDLILNVSPAFYKGEKADLKTVIEILKQAEIAVITGYRIVKELSRLGFVDEEYALKIENQLHVQIIKEVYIY